MAKITPDILKEASQLILQLRSGKLDDAALGDIVVRLNVLLPDPNYFAYTIDHVPELTAQEVVLRAFSYRPIAL